MPKDKIDEVIIGNVLSANLGQNPGRQASIKAGLSDSVPVTVVSKVCASGMKAIHYAAQSIMLGQAHAVVAAGMESMSNAPYYVPKARFGVKYGNSELIDGLEKDGLYDSFNNQLMGNAAELCAREHGFSRNDQDDYAIATYERAQQATKAGIFKDEIAPVQIASGRKKEVVLVSEDEEQSKLNVEKLRVVRPVFDANGTVTAANSSPLSDGAAALVLVSGKLLTELNIKPLAKILGFADAAKEPERFTEAPSLAIPKALRRANLDSIEKVDLFEINEAFAVVSLANAKLLKVPSEKINVFGGACALGHPLGCSGARIVVTLVNALHKKNKKIGVAGICNGGGGSSALVIEAM